MTLVRCAAAVAAVLLTGCAALQPHDKQLSFARALVDEARESGAALYAPGEFDRADKLLARGEEALRRNDTAQAKSLLAEAIVDAQVAMSAIGAPDARARLDGGW